MSVGHAHARALLLIWDGLRPDFVRPEYTPTLCRLAAQGVMFQQHHAEFPSETRVNSASLATGCHPQKHGITGNQIYVPAVDAQNTLNTGDHEMLQAVDRAEALLSVPTLSDRLSDRGLSFAVASSGSPGSSWLLCPSGAGLMVNVRGVVRPEHLESEFAPFPAESIPATARNDRVMDLLCRHLLPGDHAVVVGWFCDPDATQHKVGLGAPLAEEAIRENDRRLAEILKVAERHGYNVLVGSDHGFSTLCEPANLSAQVQTAGIEMQEFVRASGSFWLRVKQPHLVARLVEALFDMPWVGPIFSQAEIPGSFALDRAQVNHPGRAPEVMFSKNWTDQKNAFDVPGSVLGGQGASHGTCSPYDMHNVLVACGPDFGAGEAIDTPTGLIDIAPTLHYLVTGQPMPGVDGRILYEALKTGRAAERIDRHVYTAKKGRRAQFLEICDVDGTRYLEKGWVERT